MRRTVAFVIALVAFASSAALVVQGPELGRSAPGPGTPGPELCASPVAQAVGSSATVDAAGVEHSPVGLESGTPVVPDPCAGTPNAASARLEITMDNFSYTPNEIAIPANTDVVVVLTNVGSAEHNFIVAAADNPYEPIFHSDNLATGETVTMTINLPPGDWVVYCTIMGHLSLGMEGTILAK